jgi:predicted metal-dependent phosphoesterase TrpH
MFLKNANLHIHSWYSDGIYSPKIIIKAAKKRGIDVLAITDHNEIRGTLEAFDLATENDIVVILGVELFFKLNGKISELLVYFRRKEDILAFFEEFRAEKFIPEFNSINDLLKSVKDHDGLAIAPHPYAHKGLAGHGVFGEYNGVEVINSFTNHRESQASRQMAEKYGYHQFGAADMHIYLWSLRTAYTILESEKEITTDSIWKNLKGEVETINFIPQGREIPLALRLIQEFSCFFRVIIFLVKQDFNFIRIHDFKKFQKKDERFSHV